MTRARLWTIRAAVIIAAAAMIIYGCARGEMGVVLNKAINICFECIGLG